MLPAALALALTFAALALCLLPLFDRDASLASSAAGGAGARHAAERDRLVAAIRDVDLDLAMGKISEIDHAAVRASLESQAVASLAAIEAADDAQKTRKPEQDDATA